ncbi:RHS repeat-associated core domain-containing protein [Viridibacillus sp. YIM B01967]|uniref:RHS repeat-associated core domain-containing protein n=1 Tax=Viridibacillus soli TaxID=2798301 RepID=A0ABS1HBP7_9BACL|nr:DNRLRE domain-containing protein [Viridibacillus soli]MBK3496834.1 RHS repeat-associated core domain-containing protein [Viridibacillus soli]
MNIKKYIAQFLIFIMIVSLIPEYVGATFNEDQPDTKTQSSEHLEVTKDFNEIIKERTANSKTFTNGKGNFLKELYPEEVHNKVDGVYQEISEDLVDGQTGYVTTEETNLESMFPEKISDDEPLIYRFGNHELSINITNASDGDNTIEPSENPNLEKNDNTLNYKEVYPNIDLRHIALNNEVKEDWIVREFTGINEFNYSIKTDLYGEVKKDGSVGFYEDEAKSSLVFSLPKPVMVDSNYNDTLGDGARSTKLYYELTSTEKGLYELKLTADKKWLESSERVFPIYIDPSVSINALGDTYVSSKYPTANFNKQWDPSQGEYVLQTGYYDSTSGTNYPFIKFSIVGDLKGATIDSADLQAYVTHAYYATQKNGLWVDEVKGSWGANELTWNNKPSSTKITSTSVGRDEWAHFNVTDTIQAWVSGERSNYGFKFHTNGNGQTYWKKITAAESAKKAKIVIAYHYEKMQTPTMTATADDLASKTGSVTVKWKSIYGATGYDLQMFDGKGYQSIYQGTATSWNSKGQKVFPKAPYKTTSTYSTSKAGVELPLDPTAFYSVKAGEAVTSKVYKFRVIPKYPTGNGPTSATVSKAIPVPTGEPNLPTVTSGNYSETDTTNKGRGWLNIKWDKVANATGYKVRIWNGVKYENFTVGKDTLSVSTKGKKIWPTDAEIKAGKIDLHQAELDKTSSIGKGAELPIDPSTTYGNSSKRYSVRVIAMSAAGDSPTSDVNYGYIPLYAPKDVKMTANNDNLVQNKTSFDISWKASAGAKYYDVILNDGKTDEVIKVKGKTSYTTKAKYDLQKKYTVSVQAYYDDDDTASETEDGKITGKRGLSPKSTSVVTQPNQQLDLIGLEDYFTFEQHSFGRATANVNVTTGNMNLQFTDESLYTRSVLGFDFIRTYNSRSNKASVLGTGWTFIGNEQLEILSNKDILYTDEDGTTHTFVYKDAEYVAPNGIYEKLVKQDEQTWTLTDPDGFAQTFKLIKDSSNFLIASYTDNYKNQIDFVRNERGQLITVEEAKGIDKQEKIEISYQGNKISKIQYADHWTTFTYSGDLLVKTTIGSDKTSRAIDENFAYNSQNQLVEYADGNNNTTEFSYAENELKIFDKQAEDEELSVTNTYQFNVKDNEFKSISTDDAETIYKRDIKNNTYAVSQVTTPSEENQNSTELYDLDKNYRVLEVTRPDGTTDKNSYDSNGNVLTSKSTDGTIVKTYNDNNQLVKTVAANGETTTNEYEGPFLVSSTVNEETTVFTNDSFGRLIKTNYPNNTFEKISYDDDVYTKKVIDKKENTTSVQYTIFGQRKEVTDAEGQTTKYTYDPLYFDTLTSVTDGNGHKTEYSYDANNNLSSLIDALGHRKLFTYNQNDQVIQTIMPLMKFQYEYDINGELSKETLPSGIQKQYILNESNSLDTINVFDKKENKFKSINYSYDDLNNLTTISEDGKEIKSFSYTPESNFLAKYELNLFTQLYSYDDKERVTQRETNYQNDFAVKETTTYKESSDDVQQVQYTSEERPLHTYVFEEKKADNNINFTVNEDLLKRVTQFDDGNLLKSLTYTTKTQTPFEIKYDHTKNGNIFQESVQGEATTYAYDLNNQLTKETFAYGESNTYEYDPVGNRTAATVNGKKATYTYNDANQIQTKDKIAYQYDADGNLTHDENYVYMYNVSQQLTTIQTLKGEKVASYTYDENGLRLTKTVGNTTHEYLYNDEVLYMEVVKQNGKVTSTRYYEWDGYAPLGMIVQENGIKKAYQFITNHRGDILSIRDENDNEVGSYSYDAYGNILSMEGDIAKVNPIRYAGYYYDEETANYYLQARYYNPRNGAFLALDPHPGDNDEPLSQNGYTYGNNNPNKYVDHNGQQSQWLSWTRLKNAIGWGFQLLFSQYMGWSDAGAAVVVISAHISRIVNSVRAVYASRQLYKKALSQALYESMRYSIVSQSSYRKLLMKDAKKLARKAGKKGLTKALLKANFGAVDLTILIGGVGTAYIWNLKPSK